LKIPKNAICLEVALLEEKLRLSIDYRQLGYDENHDYVMSYPAPPAFGTLPKIRKES
jgi:hypothetical protein